MPLEDLFFLLSAIHILILFMPVAVRLNILTKFSGLSYEEIAKRGGGILNSAKILHDTSEDELFNQSMTRVNEIISLGTGAVEIKSGYGLNLEDELKMLRVIRRIKETSPVEVKATFLGAHAVPEEYQKQTGKSMLILL